jgi:hypothetical protein
MEHEGFAYRHIHSSMQPSHPTYAFKIFIFFECLRDHQQLQSTGNTIYNHLNVVNEHKLKSTK